MHGKERAGHWAAGQVQDGMTVGLGTGSTAEFFVRALAARVRAEGLRVRAAASSYASALLAAELGLPVLPLEQLGAFDLYADGADEVDPHKRLLKGRGAAMVREKVLAQAAARFLVLIDSGKRVERLGTRHPVPVEVFPFAYGVTRHALEALGAAVVLRISGGKDGPVITDQGNLVLDARFPADTDWSRMETDLNALPGVAGHGLFTRYADHITLVVGGDAGVELL